jgi:hypothetical protein
MKKEGRNKKLKDVLIFVLVIGLIFALVIGLTYGLNTGLTYGLNSEAYYRRLVDAIASSTANYVTILPSQTTHNEISLLV